MKTAEKQNTKHQCQIFELLQENLKQAFSLSGNKFSPVFYTSLSARIQKKSPKTKDEYSLIIKEELASAKLFKTLKQFMLLEEEIKEDDTRNTKISCKEAVEEYINKVDWRINANANLGYSNAGLINQTAGKIVANYWLDCVYSKEEGEAHRKADLHIHDLDCLTGYCAGWSLRQLLDEGFNGVTGRVSSRPPRHLNEALGQMANFLGILQSEWAGAQAFSSFDTYLAPYVFKDNLKFTDIKKAIRRFVYNLNVPARWGQSPFTNITLDFTVPNDLKDQFPTANCRHLFEGLEEDEDLMARIYARGVIKPEDMTYKYFQSEIELIDKAF